MGDIGNDYMVHGVELRKAKDSPDARKSRFVFPGPPEWRNAMTSAAY